MKQLITKRLVAFAAGLAMVAMTARDSNAGVAYSQYEYSAVTNLVTSMEGNVVTFDNFSLGKQTEIDGAAWLGAYFENGTGDLLIDMADSFTVSVYGNAGGVPGALLESQTLGLGMYSEVSGGPVGAPGYSDYFGYGAALNPFRLDAGDYWFSVTANIPSPAPVSDDTYWLWGSGVGDSDMDGVSFSTANGIETEDQIFALSGNVVPEPSSLAIVAVGGLFLTRRRKRSN
ncbi:PEP-CTERM sorting domain-containing protein [Rhodopirellula sp. MGV]|uniref:PEP-CTERM sorting domain-containing protein n=1 Tax=Rhodopirellula sp. MGV TaxID=2023130 RepID=UPI0013046BE3|nr:PEP-CTERM sorting domain-containing protein [Rhodopirellula sp. MGV]